MFLEIFIVIPLLFFYCDWYLCQDLAEKRRSLRRFDAILDQLKWALSTAVIDSRIRSNASREAWNDLSVEFEEGEVNYAFVYRDERWQRWPM